MRMMMQLGAMLLTGMLCMSHLSMADQSQSVSRMGEAAMQCSQILSLDGTEWLLGVDPNNVGRTESWYSGQPRDARPIRVPWIIQGVFPGYHGVAWYWRDFTAPANPHPEGRYLLRFWMVDYLAEVWVNGIFIGSHEGGEDMFFFDVTDAIQAGTKNRIAVRVLNPTYEPIDGIALEETPHRNKAYPISPGADYNYGGITDSVELQVVPAVWISDLYVKPDSGTGTISIQVTVQNTLKTETQTYLCFKAAPAMSGKTLAVDSQQRNLRPGDNLVESRLEIENPRLWELNDTYLYRVTAEVNVAGSDSFDEQSTRCGFREFRFENGYFRLNGRRIFIKSAGSGNETSIGIRVPHDPDLVRRDLFHAKVMGFNMIRFHLGLPRRYQLDLADEMGLLIFEGNFAEVCLKYSPQMTERFDHSLHGMILRDRNHPSIVIWELLNEESNTLLFQHAVSSLALVRSLDDSRMVLLNSGRFDQQTQEAQADKEPTGPLTWCMDWRDTPNVTFNHTDQPIEYRGSSWPPGQLALHPGDHPYYGGQYGAIRWIAPETALYTVSAKFTGLASGGATPELYILLNDRCLYQAALNSAGQGNTQHYQAELSLTQGDPLYVVAGGGPKTNFPDTAGLDMTIRAGTTVYDVTRDFSSSKNPNGVWTYGHLKPGPGPDASTFRAFGVLPTIPGVYIGSLSNPGSTQWEDVLSDQHHYLGVPHSAAAIRELRSYQGIDKPVFLSEYGFGSAIDLVRLARFYEQLSAEQAEDARLFRGFLDQFMQDWDRWKMADTFASPEEYFRNCVAAMAAGRKLGLNALRSNPHIVGYNMTALLDHGFTGEGVQTAFRELKPGTIDAVFDGLAPLRWCLFVEPVTVYKKSPVRLEAVLADEDVLPAGTYPARLQVIGPENVQPFDRHITVTIPQANGAEETPFALPVFSEEVTFDGPPGKYRFLATLEKGGAAGGGETEFYVFDTSSMPPVEPEVTLWGEDAELTEWLQKNGIRVRPFQPDSMTKRELILVSTRPAAGDAEAFIDLDRRIARGSAVVFLSEKVFVKQGDPTGYLPLEHKGSLVGLGGGAVYPKNEWARRHPIFSGLPCGGLMDHVFYREVISEMALSGQDDPAEVVAGAINTSQKYGSGLLISVYELGTGRFILNTLKIRENLGKAPVAERLLRNMLNYAGRDLSQPPAELPADFEIRMKSLDF